MNTFHLDTVYNVIRFNSYEMGFLRERRGRGGCTGSVCAEKNKKKKERNEAVVGERADREGKRSSAPFLSFISNERTRNERTHTYTHIHARVRIFCTYVLPRRVWPTVLFFFFFENKKKRANSIFSSETNRGCNRFSRGRQFEHPEHPIGSRFATLFVSSRCCFVSRGIEEQKQSRATLVKNLFKISRKSFSRNRERGKQNGDNGKTEEIRKILPGVLACVCVKIESC